MKKFKTNIVLLSILAAVGCQDNYTPDLDVPENSLVVEAILTDKHEQMRVKLSRTLPFNDRTYFNGETDAYVLLVSDKDERWEFFEYTSGHYSSKDSIQAENGVGYYLYIKTNDGEKYRSEIEIMPANNDIDKIQMADSIYRQINYNYYGEPFVKDFDGIFVSVKPDAPANPDVGYLYQWSSIINYYVLSFDLPIEYNYYCWKEMHSNTLYVYDHNEEQSDNILILDNLHFMSYYNLYPSRIDSADFEGEIQQALTTSFYYLIKQYTVTKKGVEFWKSVKQQSEASGKLFDPLEEEITTNIYCVTTPELKCLGYFNAASYSEKVLFVDVGTKQIESYKRVEEYPDPENLFECLLGEKADFWSY